MKRYAKYIAIVLLISAVMFAATFADKSEASTAPTECYGQFNLNGAGGVYLYTKCNEGFNQQGFRHVTFTRKTEGGAVSSGQIYYDTFFDTIIVFSTDASDQGIVKYKVEK